MQSIGARLMSIRATMASVFLSLMSVIKVMTVETTVMKNPVVRLLVYSSMFTVHVHVCAIMCVYIMHIFSSMTTIENFTNYNVNKFTYS